MKLTYKRAFMALMAALVASAVLVACSHGVSAKSSQGRGQSTTEAFARKLLAARPYPLGAMNDSAERANLAERLVRLNDPHKIGYLYGLSATGQVMAFWTIKGKPSSTGSQLTNSQTVVDGSGSDGGGNVPVDSMGDDGTYGPEECSGQGVFAFTADSNSLIEWCGPWFYSDAPLRLTSQPVILVDPSAKPSSDAGLNAK